MTFLKIRPSPQLATLQLEQLLGELDAVFSRPEGAANHARQCLLAEQLDLLAVRLTLHIGVHRDHLHQGSVVCLENHFIGPPQEVPFQLRWVRLI